MKLLILRLSWTRRLCASEASTSTLFSLFTHSFVAEESLSFLAKPVQEAYTRVADYAKAKRKSLVFIDDKLRNILPAYKAGMIGILHKEDMDLRGTMTRLSLIQK